MGWFASQKREGERERKKQNEKTVVRGRYLKKGGKHRGEIEKETRQEIVGFFPL